MHYGWPSPSLPKLLSNESHISTTNEEGSWIAVMPLISAVIGALLAGVTLDLMGRKKAILITAFPYFAAWIMIAFTNSIEVLYTARFITGLADGLTFTAVPMYLGEIAEPRIRGFLCSSCMVVMIIGILLINIMGSYLTIQITALISSIIPVLLLVTFAWMPESPYYLIIRENTEEAKKSLRKFRGIEDVEWEYNRLNNAVKTQMSESGKFLDLISVKSNRKAILIIFGLRSVQQFSGITAITFYAKTIFEEAGGEVSANVTSSIYFSVQLLLAALSSVIVDWAGRRPLVIISTIGSALSLCIIGSYFAIQNLTDIDTSSFSILPAIALICFIIIFSIGLQTVPMLMLGELFPTNVKAFALCVADIYFSVIAAIVSKFFQLMKDNFGMHVPFFVFTACSIMGCAYAFWWLPETKGKNLEEIQAFLRGEPYDEDRDIFDSEDA